MLALPVLFCCDPQFLVYVFDRVDRFIRQFEIIAVDTPFFFQELEVPLGFFVPDHSRGVRHKVNPVFAFHSFCPRCKGLLIIIIVISPYYNWTPIFSK